MKTNNKIRERVQVGLRISEPDYFIGLMYLLHCLFTDYFKYIVVEGRSRGIMLKYQETINNLFLDYFSELMTEDRYEFCSRIVYLYKTSIYREFRYMNKRLSSADKILVIIKRIFEFVNVNSSDNKTEQIIKIEEITTTLYNNIRWSQKETDLRRFIKTLTEYFNEGLVGKQTTNTTSIIVAEQERYDKKKSTGLSGSETLLKSGDSAEEKIVIDL